MLYRFLIVALFALFSSEAFACGSCFNAAHDKMSSITLKQNAYDRAAVKVYDIGGHLLVNSFKNRGENFVAKGQFNGLLGHGIFVFLNNKYCGLFNTGHHHVHVGHVVGNIPVVGINFYPTKPVPTWNPTPRPPVVYPTPIVNPPVDNRPGFCNVKHCNIHKYCRNHHHNERKHCRKAQHTNQHRHHHHNRHENHKYNEHHGHHGRDDD